MKTWVLHDPDPSDRRHRTSVRHRVEGGHSFLVDGVIVLAPATGGHAGAWLMALLIRCGRTWPDAWERRLTIRIPDMRLWYDASDVPFLREDEGTPLTFNGRARRCRT